ncbi:MAG TPA: 4-hydroxybenzoate octaprenyltransferase [Mariprofundaceae bacterium]|nr:4-hydroxybenzoate octaprenyltransferase [Mariprofundaceae bacterium]
MDAPLRQRLAAYARLIRLDKPIGSLLLMWPMLWALWIAGRGHPDGYVLLVFVAGVFLMRSAGCAINDYADRDFDAHVERTRRRPLAAGEIRPWEALIVALVLSLAAFALVLTMNRLTIALSFVAVALAGIYPFTKRWTHWPQLVLGFAFAWAVPMAFAAESGRLDAGAWGMFAASCLWIVAYDTEYAMVDRGDDLKIGVKSTAIRFGRFDRLIIGLFQFGFLAMLAGLGRHFGLGLAFDTGLVAALMLFGYQQWLMRGRERDPCFRAFLNNNWVGAVIFVGIVADFALARG